MKVKAKVNLFEKGETKKIGEIFEVSEERAKQLGNLIDIVEKSFKSKKDKMIKKAKNK